MTVVNYNTLKKIGTLESTGRYRNPDTDKCANE